MSSRSRLSMSELNAAALEQFVCTPVSKAMIAYLARAAHDVIQCDPTMMPPPAQNSQCPTPSRTPSPKAVRCDDSGLPTLEAFVTQLVVSSNVQVPTLMSTLVYLTRLKSRLQPMAKGLRCTTHRIFLATLILAAKYLNDSSPKNKHWASYSHVRSDCYSFGFSRTEVNLMEKQLLFLLDWDLRITEEDLYRELDVFLSPIRDDIEAKYARRMERKRQQQAQLGAEVWLATQYPSPPASRGSSRSRSRQPSPPTETIRLVPNDLSTPPPLAHTYSASIGSSSGSSYASSLSSQQHSQSSTPLSVPLSDSATEDPYVYADGSLYDSPVDIVLEMPMPPPSAVAGTRGHGCRGKDFRQMLPYEITPDDLPATKRARTGRMWRHMFGGSSGVTAR
ncbi:cyclin [Xylariaceae sp. FL0662B]|nr:cyclin [Xylariaceae sp. FL0662B]